MLEASRLARCGSDWHRLIEICSLTRTLIADEQAVYDPRQPNDRLLLGVKGTLSEAELMTLRTRLHEGRWNKARKGQLHRSIPTGYVMSPDGEWVKDPDRQVQDRLDYVFALFRQLKVARQVLLRLQADKLKLPVRVWGGPCKGQLEWKQASIGAVMRLLKNPAYSGAYVYGQCEYDGLRRNTKTGKSLPRFREPAEWPVCIQDHHEGYISWDEYLSIQSDLHRNWFRSSTRGAPRDGTALLQGIVWCGLCGAKMHVNSYSIREKRKPSYLCHHAYTQGAAHTCQSMSSAPVDKLVVGLFLDAMAPAQIEIAMQTVEKLKEERQALQKQWDQQLVQARYDAQLAQRQYDAVDPDNRLVAAELEQRWNVKLEAVQTLKDAYTEALQEDRFSISVEEAKDMKHLAKDLPRVWHAATTTDCERKQLLRLVIDEVQLDGITNPGKIDVRIGWRSGAVTHRQIDRLKVGAWAPRTDEHVVTRIRTLAGTHTVAQIVDVLNQEGLRSAHGRDFHEHHVLYIARSRGVAVTVSSRRLHGSQQKPQ